MTCLWICAFFDWRVTELFQQVEVFFPVLLRLIFRIDWRHCVLLAHHDSVVNWAVISREHCHHVLSLSIANVIMTSSKMPFCRKLASNWAFAIRKTEQLLKKCSKKNLIDWKHGNKLFFAQNFKFCSAFCLVKCDRPMHCASHCAAAAMPSSLQHVLALRWCTFWMPLLTP